MFNLGGGELMVILLVALLVLGPSKLPSAAKQVGKVLSDFRNLSAGFQREMRDAMREVESAATLDDKPSSQDGADKPKSDKPKNEGSGTADPDLSTAAEAGMYDVDPAGPGQADSEDQS